jgi:hypothetical protein
MYHAWDFIIPELERLRQEDPKLQDERSLLEQANGLTK